MATLTKFQQHFREHPESAEHILNMVYPKIPIVKYSEKYTPFLTFPYTWVTIEAIGISLSIDNAHHNKYVSYFNEGVDKLKFSFNMWINPIDKTKVKITPEVKEQVGKYINEELGLDLISPEEFIKHKLKFFTKEELLGKISKSVIKILQI